MANTKNLTMTSASKTLTDMSRLLVSKIEFGTETNHIKAL